MPAHKLPDVDPATLDSDRTLPIGQVANLAPCVAEANHHAGQRTLDSGRGRGGFSQHVPATGAPG